MTHLGTAFIFLAWLGLLGTPLWGALAISVLLARDHAGTEFLDVSSRVSASGESGSTMASA